MRTALVTGASGFIGSNLIESLARDGYRVKALLRASSSRDNLKGLEYEVAEGSLGDFESLKRACADVDVVFHLAGVTAGPSRDFYFEHNAKGSAALARAAAEVRGKRLSRFVLVSSLAAGGPSKPGSPRSETDADAPVSAYGESKLQAEQEVLRYRDQIPITILRPPLVYGPRDRGVFVIIKTLASGLNVLLPSREGGKDKQYSVIHSADLVRGITLAGSELASQIPSGEIFYLTDGRIYSYSEFTAAVLKSLGRRRALTLRVPGPLLTTAAAAFSWLGARTAKTFPLNSDKLNEILPDAWTCVDAKARGSLKFAHSRELDVGMEETVRWYREQGWLKR